MNGEIYDVAVDLRKGSNTFKEWVGIELNSKNKFILWIPEGFGHAFLTLSKEADVQYKATKKWDKNSEKSILWNDPDLNIDWPLNKLNICRPHISEKDSTGLTFKDAEKLNLLF